jgi:hypothetical protein
MFFLKSDNPFSNSELCVLILSLPNLNRLLPKVIGLLVIVVLVVSGVSFAFLPPSCSLITLLTILVKSFSVNLIKI